MMRKNLAWCGLLAVLAVGLSGCLFETALDANGGGTMTITTAIGKPADLDVIAKKLASPNVKVISAELLKGDATRGVYKIQFDDFTKLSSSDFFKQATFTRTDGADGTKVLTTTIKHDRSTDVSDSVIEKLGKEVKVVTTFPGPVVESNGTVSNGNIVTWTWPMKEFHAAREVMMTAAYKPAATAPTPAATPG